MLSRLSLKAKLIGVCLMLSAVSLSVGLTSYSSLRDVSAKYGSIATSDLPMIQDLDQMYMDYQAVRISLRSLGLTGITEEKASAVIKAVEAGIQNYEKSASLYKNHGLLPGQKELFEKVEANWEDFKKVGGQALSLYKSNQLADKEKLMDIFFNVCPQKAKQFDESMMALSEFHDKSAAAKVEESLKISSSANINVLLTILVGTLFGWAFGYLYANSVSKSLTKISESISSAADQTSIGGSQLSAASAQLSSGATQAAASLEETVASLEELSSMVKMNTDNAQQANMLSKSSRDAAEKGAEEIEKLIGSMHDIASGSKKIEEIIHVIDDIAFQTNLLALNAAVEAARAGEQGKGFAVVAEAVRTLAQKSADAAKDINSLIKDNVVKSEQGANIAAESETVLKNILMSVKKVSDLNGEIATGSQEQATGLEQISKAMNQLDQATQGNAASSEEVAASSEQMSQQAMNLSTMVTNLRQLIHGGGGSVAESKKPESVLKKSTSSSKMAPMLSEKMAAPLHSSIKTTSKVSAMAIPFDEDEGSDRRVGDVAGF